MIPLSKMNRLGRSHRSALPAAFAALALASTALHASPVPANLGNGLDRLVASQVEMQKPEFLSGSAQTFAANDGRVYTTSESAALANLALSDSTGRFMVRVYGTGEMTLPALRKSLKVNFPSVSVVASNRLYHGTGVMDLYVAIEDVPALAQMPGVSSVILELKPFHSKINVAKALASAKPAAATGETLNKLGTAFDQGVTQHRVDQINQFYNPTASVDYEGAGIQIACISNSFASHTDAGPNGPTVDVNNFDLPGAANSPVGNTTPVYVYLDDPGSEGSGDDEGRAMCQIVHKMAPKAKIAFGTADTGEVGFANVIRGLAGISGFTNNGQTFAADVICDDVGYYDEPFFQDGIIGFGITDAANAGVSYFSSAANDIGTNGYDSDTRWIPNGTGLTASAGNTALANTNINLSGVPANLYAGGFHNFNPNGLSVAQLVNIAANNTVPTIFQWNDPYDQNTMPNYTATLFSGTGNFTTAPVLFTIPATVTAGTEYEFKENANGGPTDNFDAIVTVYKSDGTTVIAGPQDTGTDETVRLVAPANDTGFVVKIDHYGSTTGSFSLLVRSYNGFAKPISTSLSLLVFNATTGAYISGSSLTSDATATNEPIQLGYTNKPSGATQVEYVIARSIVPSNPAFPTRVRYLLPGNGRAGYGPATFFTYATTTTGGHAASTNCNGCAAYSVFRPSLPETFTSPGPVMIYYDTNNNRLATPEVRLQPHFGTSDGANVSTNMSYFTSDSGNDPDTNPNFFGTSAAAPHAASIAGLVLQSKGGRRSVTPAQMTSLLERSTFPHDLDPDFASGSARVSTGGKVTISISSDGSASSTTGTTGTGGNDTHSFAINYVGGSNVTSIVFNPGGTAATGGNVSGGNNGVTYSNNETTPGGTVTYFENSFPGVEFNPSAKPFTQPTSGTVTAAATFTNPTPAVTQFYTMTLTPTSTFAGGSILYFTVGRGLAIAPTTGGTYNSVTNATTGSAYTVADIFGGGVTLPSGTVNTNGMTFSGTTADGGTFSGVIRNNIGSGWAKTDGYGFINAQTAVSQTVQ